MSQNGHNSAFSNASNGFTNGKSNGKSNGTTNGTANGHKTNGKTNGTTNGKVHGKAKPTPIADGFFVDITSMKWMRVPLSSFKLLCIPIALWIVWHFALPDRPNPFSRLIYLSHKHSDAPDLRYAKGYWDLAFLAYYIIVFSFIRQFITIHILRPIAIKCGIRSEGKLDRFTEQGYAFIYFSFFGIMGIYVMKQLPTWWFKTDPMWEEYPQWYMKRDLKLYYLLQFSYWLQQMLVLILGLEKPRKDYHELVFHHIVTLWLIGWSYLVSLNLIGNLIFVTMDVSDILLALSKTVHYLKYRRTSEVIFGTFVIVWTYLRHYSNLIILYSVWKDFDKMPEWSRVWNPTEGVWMAGWMKYQILAPLIFLQAVNIFWYFLIWRILLRALFTSELEDERSDDESEGDDKNGKAE